MKNHYKFFDFTYKAILTRFFLYFFTAEFKLSSLPLKNFWQLSSGDYGWEKLLERPKFHPVQINRLNDLWEQSSGCTSWRSSLKMFVAIKSEKFWISRWSKCEMLIHLWSAGRCFKIARIAFEMYADVVPSGLSLNLIFL